MVGYTFVNDSPWEISQGQTFAFAKDFLSDVGRGRSLLHINT